MEKNRKKSIIKTIQKLQTATGNLISCRGLKKLIVFDTCFFFFEELFLFYLKGGI